MAKSRRKASGCNAGKYKIKKMGKGWSSYRPAIGFRPPQPPKGNKAANEKGESSSSE